MKRHFLQAFQPSVRAQDTSVPRACFRSSMHNDIVPSVMPVATTRTKLAAAAFVVITLLYGSVCSTTCALGACPTETQNAGSHDCDHGASNNSHQNDPQNPDCAKHHHRTFDAVKADALSLIQLSSTSHDMASQFLGVATRSEATSVTLDALSPHLALTPNLNIPVHQQVSVLRV
jgi:hypothetical protein